MGFFDWYDTNGNGHYSLDEIDRWQLENGGYPGQFENAGQEDRYGGARRTRLLDDSCGDDPYKSFLSQRASRKGEDYLDTIDEIYGVNGDDGYEYEGGFDDEYDEDDGYDEDGESSARDGGPAPWKFWKLGGSSEETV